MYGEWSISAEIKEHVGSVYKLSWAHPEFGQILASCSADGDVNIYEEQIDRNNRKLRQFPKKGRLVDSRVAVKDLSFAPRHQGLKLATCSEDGKVRVYESSNLMDLGEWPLSQEFSLEESCNTFCWNSSPFEAPMLVVGAGSAVQLWEYQEAQRRWHMLHTLPVVHHVDWAPQVVEATI